MNKIVAAFLLGGIVLGGPLRPLAARVIDVGFRSGGEFTDIQAAIDHATDGDTVRVGAGEYLVARPVSFRGKSITVASEEGPGLTTIRMSHEPPDVRRASVVVFDSGEDRASVLEGFTLTGGSGMGSVGLYGGGVYCGEGSAPTIVNCTVTGNRAATGGGVYCALGSAPTLVNCRITRNLAGRGGGLFAASSFPPDQVAPDPEVFTSGAAPTLVDCLISQNWASTAGGGLLFDDDSSGAVRSCLISGNFVRVMGGGVFALGSRASFAECTIAGNAAGRNGGGLYLRGGVSTLVNCIVTGNHARGEGGGVLVAKSSSSFVNCTFTGNGAVDESGATGEAGGVYCTDAALQLTNCIVWNNVGDALRIDSDSRARVSFSSIEAGVPWPGPGNINLDPRFERDGLYDFARVVTVLVGGEPRELPDSIAEAPDLRLRPNSPAVDAGRPAGAPDADIEGSVRPCGASVDIGAFEMGDCPPARFRRGDCNGDANVDLGDAVCTLGWLFAGGEVPGCLAAANTNGDDAVNLADAIHSLNFLFVGGPPPAAPYPACAASPLAGDRALGCESPADCQ